MKIYDCFLFNSELDLLELRLEYLYEAVDCFVFVESGRTLSNTPKPLHYQLNKERFKKYESKIIALQAPGNDLSAWDYEYFQRNWIKEGLKSCHHDDIVFISDVDEIVNIRDVLRRTDVILPALIELPMYYYFLNLKTTDSYFVNLVAPYSWLINFNIGNRDLYKTSVTNRVHDRNANNGWHFSYLFGTNTDLYIEKVKSFSHQEFNTPYFLNQKRIETCILAANDLFERHILLTIDDSVPAFSHVDMEKYVYKPTPLIRMSLTNLMWLVRMKIINRVINSFKNRVLRRDSGK